jgi:hypothetical protein
MPGGSVHGREPELLDEILDCLGYAQAVHAGDDESSLAAYDVLHFRFAGRADAMVAPLKLVCLIWTRPESCDVDTLLEGVSTWVLAERDHRSR